MTLGNPEGHFSIFLSRYLGKYIVYSVRWDYWRIWD